MLPLVQIKRWIARKDKTLLPLIQVEKQANRALDIYGESKDTLVQKGQVINLSRVKTTGSYWSTLEDTLSHGGQMITLFGDRITVSYCSILEGNSMEDWDKYSIRFEHQYSQPRKFKVVTPVQSTIVSRSFEDNHKGKQKINFKSKFKNFEKTEEVFKTSSF